MSKPAKTIRKVKTGPAPKANAQPITTPDGARPILAWPGGKGRHLKRLLPLIPEHNCYVEAFAGGLALFFAKPRSRVEVVNDINGDLIALYRNVQYHLGAFQDEIDLLLHSRQNIKDFVDQPGLTELQRAARFFCRNRTSFAGGGDSYAVTRKEPHKAFRSELVNRLLGAAKERLDGVAVEHLPYDRCIKLYDSEDSFFFLDPPYVGASPTAYEGWTEGEMRIFRERVRDIKGKWLVTVNDSPFTRELFSDCELIAVETHNQLTNQRISPDATFGELIIRPREKQ